MRQYQYHLKEERKTEKIFCNQCGKEIIVKNEMPQEDILTVEKRWGYFSDKDTEVHRFDLCESCYDKLIAQFVIPVEKENG